MYENDPAGYKNTANTTDAPLCETLERAVAGPQPTQGLEELTNLNGELVFTDMSGPSAWLKTDPENAVDLEVMV